jgi:polygalacturonase
MQRLVLSLLLALTVFFCLPTASPAADIQPALPSTPDRQFNLTDYGAIPDGKTLNTDAFAKAFAAITAAGGGHLNVPKGTYFTLPITMTSHVDLHLNDGAVIQFPTDITAYGLPADPTQATPQQRTELRTTRRALINGDGLTDVSITGSGVIDGGGTAWWSTNRGAARTPYGNDRPKLIILSNSQRLLFQGITLQNSPMWNLVPTLCHDVTIERLHVNAPSMSPNTDAIDPQSCDTVLIRDCDLDIGDDNVAVKALDGVCCNILVENLRCLHGHGISIGSETYHGIHDVTVRNCTFIGTANGIRIKSARDRGNQIYGFHFSNITMKDVTTALTINMYYMDKAGSATRVTKPLTATTPYLRDVWIENVTATGAKTNEEIIGLPESPVKNINLTNVSISGAKGMIVRDAAGVVFKNVTITPASGEPVVSEFADLAKTP